MCYLFFLVNADVLSYLYCCVIVKFSTYCNYLHTLQLKLPLVSQFVRKIRQEAAEAVCKIVTSDLFLGISSGTAKSIFEEAF